MLSYQHIYHAGNFADVHKHVLLVRTLMALKNKNPRLTVLDTHAGRGLYDFASPEALKTEEFRNGIAGLWERMDAPSPISDYLKLVGKYNPEGALAAYPGSPLIVRDLLRPTDQMIFAELHPGEFEALQAVFAGVKNADLVKADGFDVLAARMPPADRRGLVIIDPSYEIKTDYVQVPRHIHVAWKKWPKGTFFLWYPILDSAPHETMLLNLRKTTVRDILVSEVRMEKMPGEGFAMYGSGVAVVNPPLPETAVQEITHHVAAHLPAKATADVFWLDNMKINADTGELER